MPLLTEYLLAAATPAIRFPRIAAREKLRLAAMACHEP